MVLREQRSFTSFGVAACAWILVTSFQVSSCSWRSMQPIVGSLTLSPQYGYHISALNQIQAVLTCKATSDDDSPLGLPNCIPMTDAQFSALTSVFSVGGLIGSAGANVVMDSRGRRGALRISAILTALGALLMTVASGYTALVIGRYVLPTLQNILQPDQLPQVVDRHCCRSWHMSDPNLHRRSIASENSRKSWLVYFTEPQFPACLYIRSQAFSPNYPL
jgi:hypothetical protein